MWDVTQTWWPLASVFAALAVVFVVAWTRTGRGSLVAGAVVALLLAAGCYLVDAAVVTDEEILAENVHGLAHAYRDGDRDATLSYFPEDAVGLRMLVNTAFGRIDVLDDLRITDLSVDVDGDRATTHFRANATVVVNDSHNIGYQPSRWLLTWTRRDDDWKVEGVTRLNPIDGEELAPLAGTGG